MEIENENCQRKSILFVELVKLNVGNYIIVTHSFLNVNVIQFNFFKVYFFFLFLLERDFK